MPHTWLQLACVCVLVYQTSSVAGSTAIVRSGAELAQALANQGVDAALVDVEHLTISNEDYTAYSSQLPIPVARNFSILGAWQARVGRYPYVDFAYTRNKVRIGAARPCVPRHGSLRFWAPSLLPALAAGSAGSRCDAGDLPHPGPPLPQRPVVAGECRAKV